MNSPPLELSFKRLIQKCYDTLRPGATQSERDKLREVLKELLTA